ncbi:MAG: C4-dicarboxylate ABC transporter permease, partial [Pseudomonadota bacterium]
MENESGAETGGFLATVFDGLIWFVQSLALGFYNLAYAITHPGVWLDWITWNNTAEDKLSLMH